MVSSPDEAAKDLIADRDPDLISAPLWGLLVQERHRTWRLISIGHRCRWDTAVHLGECASDDPYRECPFLCFCIAPRINEVLKLGIARAGREASKERACVEKCARPERARCATEGLKVTTSKAALPPLIRAESFVSLILTR